MFNDKKCLVIVDGYGLFFRAFYSMPALRTSIGVEIGAVYGFMNMLLRIIQNMQLSHLVIALDTGQKTFRHSIYPMYKSQRQEIPDSLKSQFPILHEAIDAMGVNKSSVLGFEADDVIATYARIYSEMYGNVVIISSDKDMLQLVLDDVIAVYDDSKKKLYKENDVLIKFGIPAAAVADYLALVGDASDNVPGVRSIGPKIATMLIKEYGTISNLYSNLVAITNLRIKKSLEIGKDLALTSLQLTVLDKHVQGLSALDDLSFSSFCLDSMANFARKYEFKSMHNINIT